MATDADATNRPFTMTEAIGRIGWIADLCQSRGERLGCADSGPSRPYLWSGDPRPQEHAAFASET
jgi:hypothetical protein